jgi:two-component system sensor histidine kinase TctE
VHLADNAFKFSPDSARIRLSVIPEKTGGAAFLVEDEGPGIPAEEREKVFERFHQLSRPDGKLNEGLGVGLTIARAVFRRLGGDVEILATPAGCSVKAVLPGPRQDDWVYGR